MTALAQTRYVADRHLRAFVRQPWYIGMSLVQPVIWLLLFGALFKSVIEIPGFSDDGHLSRLSRAGRAHHDCPLRLRLEWHVDHRGP